MGSDDTIFLHQGSIILPHQYLGRGRIGSTVIHSYPDEVVALNTLSYSHWHNLHMINSSGPNNSL
jgi:hypothetical protein